MTRETAPGAADLEVLETANQGSAVLVTGGKDFGELVYRRRQMSGLTRERKVGIALRVFADHSAKFANAFSVVTESGVCVRSRS